MSGGAGCGLLNMSVARAGTGGAVLEGGDRASLTHAGHFVQDSVQQFTRESPLV